MTRHALGRGALWVVVLAVPGCALRGLTGSTPGTAPVRPTCRDGGAAVRWIETPDSLDRRRLVQWCASVGPPLVADFTGGRREPVDSLAVVSWNTHVGGGDVIGLVAGLRSGELTGGV
ncbi:MAG: hypothetical protein OEO21_05620, partial [Candidatus Krumholzibacteria bacterium]|nr:hypothetical protein [Candidatus Krumholzibacteria bacterium]